MLFYGIAAILLLWVGELLYLHLPRTFVTETFALLLFVALIPLYVLGYVHPDLQHLRAFCKSGSLELWASATCMQPMLSALEKRPVREGPPWWKKTVRPIEIWFPAVFVYLLRPVAVFCLALI